jgi:hypothetical protein
MSLAISVPQEQQAKPQQRPLTQFAPEDDAPF